MRLVIWLSVSVLITLSLASGGHVSAALGNECTKLDQNSPILSNGFGQNPSNTRNGISNITSKNVSRLRLSFALGGSDPKNPGELARERRGAPAITEQALFYFVGNQIVAAGRRTGCAFWTATLTNPEDDKPDTPRSSSLLLVDNPSGGRMLFVGSKSGFVYGLDAADGSTLWSKSVSEDPKDRDPMQMVTGGMQYFNGRLFVPVATFEVFFARDPDYPCCSSRGRVVAFDAFDGAFLWAFDSVPPGGSGGSVWSALSVDPARNQLLIGVGQNFTQPATAFSDAIVAIDLDTAAVNWSFQATAGDAWHIGCLELPKVNCPVPEGPDFDFGAGAILADLPGSDRQAVIAGDKGGSVFSLDPATGKVNWSTKIGAGGTLGGIHWGLAVDDTGVYAGVSDLFGDKRSLANPNKPNVTKYVPDATPGVYKLHLLTGDVIWEFHTNHVFESEVVPSAFSAAVSVTNDVVFASALDGELFALQSFDGKQLWSFQSTLRLTAPDGSTVQGGTLDAMGAFAVDDTVLLNSGYYVFGSRNRLRGGPGNALFVFELPDSDGDGN